MLPEIYPERRNGANGAEAKAPATSAYSARTSLRSVKPSSSSAIISE